MRLSSPTTPGSARSLSGLDRRQYPRSSQLYRVRIRTEKLGEGPLTMQGTLINVSLGGAPFSVDRYLSPRNPCSIEICGAAGRVIPNKAVGQVVRTSVEPSGGYLSGVEFVTPLRAIKGPGEM